MNLIEFACQFTWVRSTDPEGLAQIDNFLADMGLLPGSAWCAAFVQYCLKHVGITQIYRSANCIDIWNNTHPELRLIKPESGCLIVWQHDDKPFGHIGIVTQIFDDLTVETIEGNTTPASVIDRTGDGVYLKQRHSHIVAGPMKLLGFLRTSDPHPVSA